MSNTGIVLLVYATQKDADIAVERSGSANSWDALTTIVNPPQTGYPVVDLQPIDGKVYWYKCKHSELGYTDSGYTPIVSGTATTIPDVITGWNTSDVTTLPTNATFTQLTASLCKFGAVTYDGLQTGSIIVQPAAFVGTNNSTTYTISGDGSYLYLAPGAIVLAPIHLPPSAKNAHNFSAIFNTHASASTTTVELMHINGWDTGSVTSVGQMAIVNVSGTAGVRIDNDVTNAGLTQNHQVWVQITGGSASHYIYGVRFDYIY